MTIKVGLSEKEIKVIETLRNLREGPDLPGEIIITVDENGEIKMLKTTRVKKL